VNHHYRPLTAGPTKRAIPIAQAVETSSALGHLVGQIQESSQRMKTIEDLIPQALRSAIRAGPIDGDSWCLLVTSNAAAAKLRQLSPALLTRLINGGLKVNSIRLKILIAQKC
jgi:hypothetical protein